MHRIIPLWTLETDYYLHNSPPKASPFILASTNWWELPLKRFHSEEQNQNQNHNQIALLFSSFSSSSNSNSMLQSFNEFYKVEKLTSFERLLTQNEPNISWLPGAFGVQANQNQNQNQRQNKSSQKPKQKRSTSPDLNIISTKQNQQQGPQQDTLQEMHRATNQRRSFLKSNVNPMARFGIDVRKCGDCQIYETYVKRLENLGNFDQSDADVACYAAYVISWKQQQEGFGRQQQLPSFTSTQSNERTVLKTDRQLYQDSMSGIVNEPDWYQRSKTMSDGLGI